jgi:hypothetical protein
MSTKSSRQFNITVTAANSKSPKPRNVDQQVAQFEQKLLDLISDPTTKYLLKPHHLLQPLVKALAEVRDGLVVS